MIVEGMYSMLGDTAPLPEFVEVKKRHGAWLLVDEAHSFGCFGAHGRGLAEQQGVEEDVDFVVGTFSKSLGAIGGFGASNHPQFDLLRLCARPYMFTASPSPASIASVHAALRPHRRRPEPARRSVGQRPAAPCRPDRAGPATLLAAEPGDRRAACPTRSRAARAWNLLREHGVYVNLALPPGTPNSLCLLRCSVSAAHTFEQIDEIVSRFGAVMAQLDVRTPALAATA